MAKQQALFLHKTEEYAYVDFTEFSEKRRSSERCLFLNKWQQQEKIQNFTQRTDDYNIGRKRSGENKKKYSRKQKIMLTESKETQKGGRLNEFINSDERADFNR